MAECQHGKNKHSHILQSNIYIYVRRCYIISQKYIKTNKQRITSTSIAIQILLKNYENRIFIIQPNNTEDNDYSKEVYVYTDGGTLPASIICEKINIPHKEELLFLRSVMDYFL